MTSAQVHTLPITKYISLNSHLTANNINNNNSKLNRRLPLTPHPIVNSMPHQPEFLSNSPPSHHSLSPPPLSQESPMSPSPEHRNNNGNSGPPPPPPPSTDGYQPNGIYLDNNYLPRTTIGSNNNNSIMSQYTMSTSPPKKSFCIDALLSKTQTDQQQHNNGDRSVSPNSNRFLSDEDNFRKYSEDRGDFTPSPDGDTSR